MPRQPNAVPVYRRHKPTNQAVCTVRLAGGWTKDIYLGRWNSAASKAEYNRVVALVVANGGIYPEADPDLTVNEALARYVRFIDGYYLDSDGTPSLSGSKIKKVLRYLRLLFGPTLLADFGPVELKAIRATMIRQGIVRKQINKAATTIRQFLRWAVEEQLIPSSVWETLRAVRPLAPGRSGAAEGEPRQPADPSAVEAALPCMSPAVRAIVQLLRLTGARPTEILTLRPCDLDRSGEVWKYTLAQHKCTWRGKTRIIYFGPESKMILAPWLLGTGPEEFVFSPRRSEEMRSRQRSEERRTPRFASHMRRNELKRPMQRKLPPSEKYDHCCLARAVARACRKAKVKSFSPYQLRHLRAVELRAKYGLEFVRATLGQSYLSMSDHYSKAADEALASKAAAEVG
jgi:integrase